MMNATGQNWRRQQARNRGYDRQQAAVAGPLDLLIVSSGEPGSEPWFLFFNKSQVGTNNSCFVIFKKFIKEYKPPSMIYGWVFTFDGKTKWHCLSNEGTPNCVLLGDWLADEARHARPSNPPAP